MPQAKALRGSKAESEIKLYANRKVALVTGHSGFKGSWLVLGLIHRGYEVYGLSNQAPEDERHIFWSNDISRKLANSQKQWGDVRRLGDILGALEGIEPDIVFHLAAQPLVSVAADSPQETFSTNIMGTVNVLEALNKDWGSTAGVIVTSDKCYLNLDEGEVFTESSTLGGLEPYSASKAAAEMVFRGYAKTLETDSRSIITVRAGNVFGGGDWSKDRLIPDFMRSMNSGADFSLRKPSSIRPWTYVMDILRGYVHLGEVSQVSSELHGESFNLASSEILASKDVVQILSEELGELSPSISSAQVDNVDEPLKLSISAEKIGNRYGWQPLFNLEDSLKETARWYQLQANGSGVELQRLSDKILKRYFQ